MSYPFSAVEMDGRTVPAEPKREIYACAYTAWLPTPLGGKTDFGCCYVLASSKAAALIEGMSNARNKLRECDGYLNHRVLVSLIEPDFLARAGYYRSIGGHTNV